MPTVLVVDDEWKVRAFLRETLTRAGYQVLEAADGQRGLDLYKSSPADLVIMDLFLQGQQGLETILQFQREFPDAKLIAISGGGQFDDPAFFLQAARSVGAAETLAKPFGVDELLRTVERALKV